MLIRTLLFAISFVFIMLIFSGCGENNTPLAADPAPVQPAAPIVIMPDPTPTPAPTPEPVEPNEPNGPEPPAPPEPGWQMYLPSLAKAFEPFFLFGNIYSTGNRMTADNTRYAFLHHFNAVTAENWHKPDAFGNRGFERPLAADYNFVNADAIVYWAVENELTLIGHALVWHSQSPDWLFFSEPDTPLTRAEARENMHFHIRTLSEHWAARGLLGAFYAWDVVNEAIASGGGSWVGDWRTQLRTDSPWFRAYANGYDPNAGEHPGDYIYDAFVFARLYFPYSVLYYNDYNEEIPAKRNAIAQMVEELNQRWAHDFENNHEAVPYGEEYTGRLLIEGIGLQSHMHLDQWRTNMANIRGALTRFAQTGVRLSITELDITIGGQGGDHPPTFTPYLPEAEQERHAAAFRRVFMYYLEFADYIERVTVWGKADGQSWRYWGHPVLFDHQFNAKPNFFAIQDVVAQRPKPVVDVPVINETSLHAHWVGAAYSGRVTAHRNNWSPLRFHVTAGELPLGLTLFATTGVINGFPTEAGAFTFTITATNAGGSYSREFTILIG